MQFAILISFSLKHSNPDEIVTESGMLAARIWQVVTMIYTQQKKYALPVTRDEHSFLRICF
jgi:hypothetical protein